MPKKKTSSPAAKADAGKTERESGATPRNHRELAQAILAQCDPVKVGCELLESGNERGSTVRARVWETLANWQFGKPAQGSRGSVSGAPAMRIIWDMPAPAREAREPDES
jgi:hypothetical protein